jgi:hypothetical protein
MLGKNALVIMVPGDGADEFTLRDRDRRVAAVTFAEATCRVSGGS